MGQQRVERGRYRVHLAVAVLALAVGLPVTGGATVLSILAQQDATLSNTAPNSTINSSSFLFVGDNTGDRDYQSIVGFDMSPVTAALGPGDTLVINSLTFSAWHNFYSPGNPSTTAVDVGIGLDDNWMDSTATYAVYGDQHGGVVNTQNLTSATVNQAYITWDLSSVSASEFLSDDYLTVYMFVDNAPVGGNNWNDFEPEENSLNHEPFLRIDFAVNAAAVPEPQTVGLVSLGALLVMARGSRRRSQQLR